MSFLQIASWNIEHLSGASRQNEKQTAFALAEHIEMAGIDIIALQEVYVTHFDDGERRNEDLDRVTELLEEHLKDPWSYKIFPNRNEGDKSQLCCLMWNTNRVEKTEEMKIAVSHEEDGYALWDRTPHAVKFTMLMDIWHRIDGEWETVPEKRSVVIVPLHMKSNYGGTTINKRKRKKEAEVLCAKLDEVRAMDESLILIGDTNCLDADEPAITKFIDNDLIDLNNNDSTTYWSPSYGESPFDRAFVATGRHEFKYTRQYVLRSSDLQLHDRLLSDHYMIKISVKTYLDDADPR